jgi:6-carboxyhexanoate--CoA ligase
MWAMWNIRMRASKKVRSQKSEISEMHISGAEGLYEVTEISKISNDYIKRALKHPIGKPDKIVITIEEIKEKPRKSPLLPVTTIECDSPDYAEEIIFQKLSGLNISRKAINLAFKLLKSEKTMRGAALITAETGKRIEPDRERGIRVSRLGMEKSDRKRLGQFLSKLHINNITVKEALILASKVASCRDIIAEICISDDPDYTTGYIASKKFGYLRIPNIKNYGEMHGGRVFFVRENADADRLIEFLEKTPVVIYRV